MKISKSTFTKTLHKWLFCPTEVFDGWYDRYFLFPSAEWLVIGERKRAKLGP